MYNGSEEELRAAEMAGRVYDNLCTSTPVELHGIRQMHTSHIGGASIDCDNVSTCGSHNTSSGQQSHRRRIGGTHPPSPLQQLSGVNAVVEVARRESVLRQLYNDKLRGSISAILSALMNELPRDHIFLQLLSDPSTEQYCRVRVGEVVESFLFSVQAHQYHNLASELAKREVEVLTLSGQLEEALQESMNTSPPVKSFKTTQTDNRTDAAMNTEFPSQQPRGEVGVEQAAQDELIALLEDVTREHELAKCRECLSAPMSLLETVQAEGNYRDKYEYLADVVGHLFRSVQGLVLYADGSLNSLDSLRHSLHGVWGSNDMNAGDVNSKTAMHPPRPSVSSAATVGSPSPSSSAGATATSPVQQQRSAIFEEERARLEMLAKQLKYAQNHCSDIIQSLAKGQVELQRQSDARQHQLEQLQQLTVKSNTQELSKAVKANEAALVQLREDLQKSFAAERAQARGRERELEQRCAQQASELQQVTQKLAMEQQKLEKEVEWRTQAEQRMKAAEELAAQAEQHRGAAVSDLHRDLEAEKNALHKKLQAAQIELIARRAEAVCAQKERMLLDAQITKMEHLLTHGYKRVAAEQHYSLLLAKEAVRHAQTQAMTEQRAMREHEANTQQCYEGLRSLLDCMREDDYKAELQQREVEADTESRRCRVAFNKNTNKNPENGVNRHSVNGAEVNMNESSDGHTTQVLLHRYGTPKTLTGLVTALQNSYEAVQRHQRYMQGTVDAAGERMRQMQQECTTLRMRLEQLTADYEQQRANFKRTWDEQAMWERQDTLKGLLAKQEALLAAVNVEREGLQVRWSTLSEEYQLLERRNSQLHERCAAKEAENARLLGYLRAKRMTSSSSISSQQQQMHFPSQGAVHETPAKVEGSPVPLANTAAGITKLRESTVETSPDVQRTETSTLHRHRGSRGSSSAAGLSGQARTPCSSLVEEEDIAGRQNAVGVVVPLGRTIRDRGAWRPASRHDFSAAVAAPAVPVAAEEEEQEEEEEEYMD